MDNKPLQRLRLDGIEAAIWSNKGPDGGAYYTITFRRRFLGTDQKWQTTQSFRLRDLLGLAKIATEAHDLVRLMLGRTTLQVVEAAEPGDDESTNSEPAIVAI